MRVFGSLIASRNGHTFYSTVCQLNGSIAKQKSRWFQTCFMFTPTIWEDSRFAM